MPSSKNITVPRAKDTTWVGRWTPKPSRHSLLKEIPRNSPKKNLPPLVAYQGGVCSTRDFVARHRNERRGCVIVSKERHPPFVRAAGHVTSVCRNQELFFTITVSCSMPKSGFAERRFCGAEIRRVRATFWMLDGVFRGLGRGVEVSRIQRRKGLAGPGLLRHCLERKLRCLACKFFRQCRV